MFKGRRNRSQTGPLPLGSRPAVTAPSSAASTAAMQAFLANRDSNANLSSAAAAAALRSHTTTPTRVGDVQTKRMQRRGSIGSNASAPALHRRTSSGSMSERNFRDPSPRRASTVRPGSRARDDPPPLPAVPKALSPAPGQRGPRPRTSQEMGRVRSPPPRVPAARTGEGETRKQRPNSSLAQAPEPGSPGRGSVNFSRPMSPSSPPASPTFSRSQNKTDSARAAPEDVLPGDVIAQTQHAVLEAGSKPVKKKKKRIAPEITEGSHLEKATSGSKPTGTAVRAAELSTASSQAVDQASSQPPKTKKKQPVTESAGTSSAGVASTATAAAVGDPVRANRASGQLAKQPSVVREDREGEALAEKANPPKATGTATKAPVTPQTQTKLRVGASSGKSDSSSKTASGDSKAVRKDASVSPARAARFAAPVLEPGNLHQPLGRSASPSKSAMKHSPSPRNASPNDMRGQSWNRPGFTPSEASDTPSAMSEETRRKKKFRVSFDVEPIVVGEAADPMPGTGSPIVASPQNEKSARRAWFPFGRDKTKPHPLSDDADDVIQPMPTLPSFGSIRGKRDSLNEDDHEDERPSTSDDHVEAVVVAEKTPEAPRETLDPNEPVPPQVTSVEGSGYHSEEHEDAHMEPKANGQPAPGVVSESKVHEISELLPKDEVKTTEPSNLLPSAPPTIELQPATPGLETEDSKRDSYLYVPGGWSESAPDKKEAVAGAAPTPSASAVLPADQPAASPPAQTAVEPDPSDSAKEISEKPQESVHKEGTAESKELPLSKDGEESDESGDSVYSDAASEATEMDGDGYGSINAIVESPAPKKNKANPMEELEHTPPLPKAGKKATRDAAVARSEPAKAPAKTTPTKTPPTKVSPAKAPLKSALKKKDGDEAVVPIVVKKPRAKKQPAAAGTAATAASASVSITKPPAKATSMRKSMRDSSPASAASPSRMRTSMRAPDTRDGPMRMMTSARESSAKRASKVPDVSSVPAVPLPPAPEGRATLQKRTRPLSGDFGRSSNLQGTKTVPRQRPMSVGGDGLPPITGTVPAVPIPKQKFAGYDSDSDSSFRRVRRARSSSDTRVSMRRSMRSKPPDQTSRPQSQVFSTGGMAANSRRNSSMKATMRAAAPEPEARPKTPTRSLFGRSSKKTNVDTPPSIAPRFRSRFVDSDDEDGGALPGPFRSRFADSSDEEEPPQPLDLTPVRGIPKRSIDGDSTDLEGEAESRHKKSESNGAIKPLGEAPETAAAATTGPALATKTMRADKTDEKAEETAKSSLGSSFSFKRPDGEKRRSIFGSFARRKDRSSKVGKSDLDTPERSRMSRANLTSVDEGAGDVPASAVQSPRVARSPLQSPVQSPRVARSPVGSPVQSPRVARSPERPMSPPRSPKLQRRTLSRTTSAAWPLPSLATMDHDRPPMPRPMTSDGSGRGTPKFSLGTRAFRSRPPSRPSTPPLPLTPRSPETKIGEEPVLGRGGKKKRFQGLRKAFGLKD